jgi:hypothetical protein
MKNFYIRRYGMTVPLRNKKNTTVYKNEEGTTLVILYSTEIVRLNSSEIILNSGGYYTDTTKNRMNLLFREEGIPLSIYQEKRKWYVKSPQEEIPFYNGMIIDRFELALLNS